MSNLGVLNLEGCGRLQYLPPPLGKMRNLKENFIHQITLEELPKDYCELESLVDVFFYSKNDDNTASNDVHFRSVELTRMSMTSRVFFVYEQVEKALTNIYISQTTLKELPTDFGELGKLLQVFFGIVEF